MRLHREFSHPSYWTYHWTDHIDRTVSRNRPSRLPYASIETLFDYNSPVRWQKLYGLYSIKGIHASWFHLSIHCIIPVSCIFKLVSDQLHPTLRHATLRVNGFHSKAWIVTLIRRSAIFQVLYTAVGIGNSSALIYDIFWYVNVPKWVGRDPFSFTLNDNLASYISRYLTLFNDPFASQRILIKHAISYVQFVSTWNINMQEADQSVHRYSLNHESDLTRLHLVSRSLLETPTACSTGWEPDMIFIVMLRFWRSTVDPTSSSWTYLQSDLIPTLSLKTTLHPHHVSSRTDVMVDCASHTVTRTSQLCLSKLIDYQIDDASWTWPMPNVSCEYE